MQLPLYRPKCLNPDIARIPMRRVYEADTLASERLRILGIPENHRLFLNVDDGRYAAVGYNNKKFKGFEGVLCVEDLKALKELRE